MAGAAASELHAAVEEVWKSFTHEMDEERRKMREAQELWDEQKTEEKALEQKEMELAQQISALEEEKNQMRSRVDVGQIVELNVGGQYFTTSSNTLQSQPDSMIGAMFSRWDIPKDKDGRFFIDRDPKFFSQILNYLRDPDHYEFNVAEEDVHHFRTELTYFGLCLETEFDEPEPAPAPAPAQPTWTPAQLRTIRCVEKTTKKKWKWGDPALTALTELGLSGNQITDVTPLQHLTALTKLYLDKNQIADIGPLQHLTALTRLYLQENQIADIGPLRHLTALTSLSLGQNQTADIGPLQHLTALTQLYLSHNQIADTDPTVVLLKSRGCSVRH